MRDVFFSEKAAEAVNYLLHLSPTNQLNYFDIMKYLFLVEIESTENRCLSILNDQYKFENNNIILLDLQELLNLDRKANYFFLFYKNGNIESLFNDYEPEYLSRYETNLIRKIYDNQSNVDQLSVYQKEFGDNVFDLFDILKFMGRPQDLIDDVRTELEISTHARQIL